MKTSNPLVSIVVPAYDAASYLPDLFRCLESQTYDNIETIFVNDGSTDETLALLRQIVREKPNYRLVNKRNGGAGAARNAGVARASGAYIICIDADDVFEPNLIESLARPFALDPLVDISICNLDDYLEAEDRFQAAPWAIDRSAIPHETVFDPRDIPLIFNRICGYAANKMVRASLIAEHHLQWQEITIHEDMAFSQTALAVARRAYYVDEPLYHHRKRKDQNSLSDLHQDTRFECLFLALEEIGSNLRRTGCWENYEEAYLNYALSQCLWKHWRVSATARKEVGNALGSTWFKRLGLTNYPQSYYKSSTDYQTMLSLCENATPLQGAGPWNPARDSNPKAVLRKIRQLAREQLMK